MNDIEELTSQAVHLVTSAAYKEATEDGYSEDVAKYVAAKVHHAFEIGWNSATANITGLIKKLEIN